MRKDIVVIILYFYCIPLTFYTVFSGDYKNLYSSTLMK